MRRSSTLLTKRGADTQFCILNRYVAFSYLCGEYLLYSLLYFRKQCPECDKTFSRGEDYRGHLRWHAGELFECTHEKQQKDGSMAPCGAKFATEKRLRRHVDHQHLGKFK